MSVNIINDDHWVKGMVSVFLFRLSPDLNSTPSKKARHVLWVKLWRKDAAWSVVSLIIVDMITGSE